ncbi:UPF0184 protein C9orf16 homolog isoform X1 [Cricetulus griseus]|uniref:UPF0184 protein C9orf16 homolog isoform X1 n=1 Tax=Cricetulus griseus TaxID=10029 RepID=A0A9J7G914_CRIGR|nr:UPF0184 protein C9orf16 homolog isoform X1 [Cricetulus griseus]XP_027279617.1 UPF0184 protein C9orf16 homolog isoform X1 [Cricetulus griseus]
MSGPNGDLGMPADAGAEGENDSFGEAVPVNFLHDDTENKKVVSWDIGCTCLSALRRHWTFPLKEYAAINSMLDQINSCLDHLEEKNDHLHARLQELLESNRQTRLEFQQQLGEAPSDASP